MTTSASAGASSASSSPILCLRVGDLSSVEARVGTGEVHVLEDAEGPARTLRPVARQAVVVYNDDLARLHVAQELRADDVEPAGLAGDGVAAIDLADARGVGSRGGRGRRRACHGRSWRQSRRLRSRRIASRTASPTETSPLQLPHGRGRDVGRVRGGVEPEAVLGQTVPQLRRRLRGCRCGRRPRSRRRARRTRAGRSPRRRSRSSSSGRGRAPDARPRGPPGAGRRRPARRGPCRASRSCARRRRWRCRPTPGPGAAARRARSTCVGPALPASSRE